MNEDLQHVNDQNGKVSPLSQNIPNAPTQGNTFKI